MSKTKKKDKKQTRKNLGGRPKKEIEFSVLEQLCAIHCTQKEICSFFKVDDKTLSARIREIYGISFSEYYREFSDDGKVALRRMQWKSANKGSVPMQRWLGANILGQKNESPEIKKLKVKIPENATAADVVKASVDGLRKKELSIPEVSQLSSIATAILNVENSSSKDSDISKDHISDDEMFNRVKEFNTFFASAKDIQEEIKKNESETKNKD